MKKFGLAALLSATIVAGAPFAITGPAKADPLPPPPGPCDSLPAFFLTSCQLSWYGVRFYGTVDLGGLYQTHGTPFDKNFPTGASYIVGAGGTGAT
ncbi:MAG: hypothetical protein ACLPX7_24025, partial [Xanthobacteraceae bacterium]